MPSDSSTPPVTFLFTDIEGSTRLWSRDPRNMSRALEVHDRILQNALIEHGGRVFGKSGDSFAAVFESAPDGIRAALAGQLAIEAQDFPGIGTLRVRMALHAGRAEEREGDFFGTPLNRCARLLELANGGQVVCSDTVARMLADRLPDGIELIDLGEHRLRDFLDPERVFHIAHPDLAAAAPLRRRAAAASAPPTSFVGRGPELDRVRQLLGDSALVTLTGLGGVGKTRMAQELLRELADDYADGTWHIDLSPASDPAAVADAVARALGVLERPPESLIETLVQYLAPRTVLLVLDNCEHVVDAAAKFVDRARQAAPGLTILATSREPLGISGERIWSVAPLSIPGASTPPGASDSEALFADRARLIDPDLALDDEAGRAVARICRLLDGIPLAIELAAALVRVLTPAEIAGRLDDRFSLLTGGSRLGASHHQTLLATMDWSHELLAPAERILLRRLSVFRGGFSLEAATAVCAFGEINAALLIPIVARLVETSLVDRVPAAGARYHLLETVREYAARKLAENGETEDLNRRHARYFLTAGPGGPDGVPEPGSRVEWFAFRHAEYDSYRAALGWAIQADELGLATGLAIQLGNYWLNSGCCVGEGNQWLQTLIERLDSSPSPELQRVLTFAAMQAAVLGNRLEAEGLAEQIRSMADALEDPAGMAAALTIQASTAQGAGDLARAGRLAAEAYRISAEIGDARAQDKLLHRVQIYCLLGDYDAAEQCLDLHREITTEGELEAEYQRRLWEGTLAYMRGRLDDAAARLTEAIDLIHETGRSALLYARLLKAQVDLARGDPRRAAAGARVASDLAEDLGDSHAGGNAGAVLAEALHELGEHPGAAAALDEGIRILSRVHSPLIAVPLARVGALLNAESDPEAAVAWLGAHAALLRHTGAAAPSPERTRFKRQRTRVAARLGREFEAAWERAAAVDAGTALALIESGNPGSSRA